jgi:hypothetical protein
MSPHSTATSTTPTHHHHHHHHHQPQQSLSQSQRYNVEHESESGSRRAQLHASAKHALLTTSAPLDDADELDKLSAAAHHHNANPNNVGNGNNNNNTDDDSDDRARRNVSFYHVQRKQSVYDERTLRQLASPLSARGSNDADAAQRRRLLAVAHTNVRRAVAAGVAAAGLSRAWLPIVVDLASHAVELLDADSTYPTRVVLCLFASLLLLL